MKFDLRCMAAVSAAKFTRRLCKWIGRAGTSLPGKVALAIDPRILLKLSRGYFVVMVTGTNGKTTTIGTLSKIMSDNGLKHIVNKGGANLISGIATTFAGAADVWGNASCALALLEVDEATAGRLVDSVQPDVMVVTNFFRDQLDRYGEVQSVMHKVQSAIDKCPKVKLVLNADDSLCVSLGVKEKREAVYFGVEQGAVRPFDEKNISTTNRCIFCGTKYDYSYRTLGHLGGFKCPNCGFARPEAQIACTRIESLQPDSSVMQIAVGGETRRVKVGLPGLFNIYNVLAAAACCHLTGLPLDKIVPSLDSLESCFGRMETIDVGEGKQIMLMLTKNPVGFNQILRYLTTVDGPNGLAFLINDNAQDGTDISWLWDIDFEKVSSRIGGYRRVYASGSRAEDIALRLKYAGIPTEKLCVQKDYDLLIREGLAGIPSQCTFFIAASYTAMLEIRGVLKKSYKLKEIWR